MTMCTSGYEDAGNLKAAVEELMTDWPYTVPKGKEPYGYQVSGNHYQRFAIQPHEYIVKNNIPWSAANAIKYLTRYRFKGGKQDLLKAIHYIELALAEEYPE